MNLVDCYVTEVLSEPVLNKFGGYEVKVKYVSWGTNSDTALYFQSLDKALEVKKGYCFLG